MVIELIIVWIVGVVAFFALWAGLLWAVRRISEKRRTDETNQDNSGEQENTTDKEQLFCEKHEP